MRHTVYTGGQVRVEFVPVDSVLVVLKCSDLNQNSVALIYHFVVGFVAL